MPTETQPVSQVFISYSRTDRAACVQLRTGLEKAGLSAFRDEDDIQPGDEWITGLEKALEQCTAFVLLIGKDGVQRWVSAEYHVALRRHNAKASESDTLPIFPVLLEDAQSVPLPAFLSSFQSVHWNASEPLPPELIAAIKNRTTRSGNTLTFEGCPFLGLSAFGRQHAPLFFGRRQETLKALEGLGDQHRIDPQRTQRTHGEKYFRWLQIEGNSGSGKSSLVNAGMLPLIEQGFLLERTGFAQWRILGPMMPGKNPVKSLRDALIYGLTDEPLERIKLADMIQLEKPASLADAIKAYRTSSTQTAYLLIVDQFEELFTFADETERKQFDALLAHALADPECPLFLINTVRADFLDRFEYLPQLQTAYNDCCKRYFLPLISAQGLQDCIEQPAKLAGLDVSEITTAILKDTQDEIGALPLVENALLLLWQQRQDHKLSGKLYQQQGGIAGMLSNQADALLARIDQAVPQGKLAALELLLRLTRINDEGRHTRQRVALEEAVFVAGNGDDKTGRKVVGMLSGQRDNAVMHTGHHDVPRLITINQEQDRHYADLIHETLIRSRGKDITTGKLIGYWPTLFDYIDNNRDRDHYRQLLIHESQQWQHSKGFGRIWNLRWFGFNKFHQLRIPKHSIEGRFLAWSRRVQLGLVTILAMIVGYGIESVVWVQQHDLSPDMIWTLQRFRFGNPIMPVLNTIPSGSFNMGEQDEVFIASLGEYKKNFGVPGKAIQITQPFYLGKTEITYEQYDYYVWQQHRADNTAVAFPNTAKGGRGDRPVVNVSWVNAMAYAHWLGKQTGKQCRLPTEAEWEYAARAGTTSAYHWGDKAGKNNANCNDCGSPWDNQEAAPVGSFSANKYGLHDMSGNVWEWICSNWREQFDGSEQHCNNDADFQAGVVRGGCWGDNQGFARSSARDNTHLLVRRDIIGFRVLCESPIE